MLNLIININIQEDQVVKNSQDHISSVFSLKIFIVKITKTLCDRRIYHHVSCSQLFGFFPLGLCRRQSRNRQIHRQVCWKRHRINGVVGKERNIGFVGILGNVERKWCRKYRKWLCCEISQLNPDLRRICPFGGIFCLTFAREGCSSAAPLDEPPLMTWHNSKRFHWIALRTTCTSVIILFHYRHVWSSKWPAKNFKVFSYSELPGEKWAKLAFALDPHGTLPKTGTGSRGVITP